MPFTQQQAIALLSLLSEGKLISELTELLSLDTDNNFVAINSGSNDAKKIKIPLLRGYKGTYDASTNTPSLSNTVGLDGDMYVVSVAGSRNFGAGVVNLLVDDIIIYLNGKYVKTNGIVTGSLDLQGVYDNSSPKKITVADSIDGTLTVKDSSTNNERDEILQVQDTSGNILFYVQRDKSFFKGVVEIAAESGTSPILILKNTSTSSSEDSFIAFQRDDGTGGWSVGNDSTNNNFQISKSPTGVASNVVLYITPSRNVGIGIEPSEKFEVDGIVKATKFYGNDFASGSPVVGIKGKGSGQSYVMYTSSTDDTKTLMDFLEVVGHSTVIRLNNDGVRKVQISSSGDSYFDIGNFGVGTTSPSEKIEVAGNVKVVGHIKLEDHLEIRDQNTAVSEGQNLKGVQFYTSDFSFNPPLPLERATTPIVRILPVAEHPNGDSYGLAFYTSDTDSESVERMRITSQGNLELGGNIYERFNITEVTTNAHTLSDTDRMILYTHSAAGTLTIPAGLSNKVWEIVNTDSTTVQKDLDVNPGGGASLTVVKNYHTNNDSEILKGHTGKIIRTGTNGYLLIKY